MKKGAYIQYAILGNLKTYYATYLLIFVAYPLINSLYTLLEAKRVSMHDLGIDQGSDDTGIAEKKQLSKEKLVATFKNISDPLAGLYKSRKDLVNYKKMKYVVATLLKSRPEKLLQETDAVIAFCNEHIADCTEAGITTAKIAKLVIDRDAYSSYANLPNSTRKLKTGVTKKINTLNLEVSDIIHNQLNGAMKAIIDDEPEAYNEYVLLVEPIREGVHSHNNIVAKAPLSLKAVHDLTGDPLADVPLKLSGVKGTFKTNADGLILANLPLGAYIGKIVFIDFVAQSFSFTLTADGYELTIRLVPVGV